MIRRTLSWCILNGPFYAFMAVAGAVVIGTFCMVIWGLIFHTAATLAGFIVPAAYIGSIVLWSKFASWRKEKMERIIQWAKDNQDPEERFFEELASGGLVWAGTGPGEDWYVVAESGGARAGPMTRARADELIEASPLTLGWGKCTIEHKSGHPDPILRDLEDLAQFVEDDND